MTGVIQYDRVADNVLQRLDRIERQLAHLSKWAAPIGDASMLRFVPFMESQNSTNYFGQAFSTTSKTLIDVSVEFGVPENIAAIYLAVLARDSGSATNDVYVALSPSSTNGIGPFVDPAGLPNNYPTRESIIIPCNANGDIYIQIIASGTLTFDVWLYCWGYWEYT